MLLQMTEYNNDKDEYCKNKTKNALPSKFSTSFSGSDDEVVYTMVSIKINLGKRMSSGH